MKVLKFGATWCPGCMVMKPRWKEIEAENPWLQTEYYDFDEHMEVLKQYNVWEALPVFVFLDNKGNELLRLQGEIAKDKLVAIIHEYRNR